MLISLAVRLLIPDTTAISALRSLRQQSLAALLELRREVCWGFDIASDVEAAVDRLLRTDVLVNQNKHRVRWWAGDLELAPSVNGAGLLHAASVLVESRDDPDVPAMQQLLSRRLGFADLRVVRHGTLWHVVTADGGSSATLARHAIDALLANPHGQIATLLGGS